MRSLKLQQNQRVVKKSDIDKSLSWIMVFNRVIDSDFPYAEVFSARRSMVACETIDIHPIVFDLPNALSSHVSYGCIDDKQSSFALLTLARRLVAGHAVFKSKAVSISVVGFDAISTERITEAIMAAVLSGISVMPSFKKKQKKRLKALNRITLYGIKKSHEFRRTFAESEGNALARSLSMLPPNKLTPAIYLQRVRKLAKENKWKLQVYNTKKLQEYKAGAFLAVSQGSPKDDAGIVKLTFNPMGKNSKSRLVLVGKGICYDTGGVNLKPARHMFGMHEDMQGSAVALGTFLALTRLQVDFSVECWLALAMNHIGSKAYKPNDLVTAYDGTTIEVVHTDAEGRMVLADTLAMATQSKPKLIIDYATLTGDCIYSLGTAYSGVFTNQELWLSSLIEAGVISGERVWPFPIDEDFEDALSSDIADIKQCSLDAGVDHILAAKFLQRFVKNKTPWVHVDLSSSHHKGGLAHIPTDTIGFGIRFTLQFLLDKKKLWLV
ncbi:Cytosol aminopeptidase PepA [uncultured Candidatus Thioglobus sp.]|nr:Cytosol aminopeptidase PepA [uncultured Candidatus Thioglobus sp.]